MPPESGYERAIAKFEAEPPIVVFGRQVPFLYAEHRVAVAQRHLLGHLRSDARFSEQHHDFYDGRFRRMMLVISQESVRFAPSVAAGPHDPTDPLTPQPHRLRAALLQTLDLTRRALDGFDDQPSAPLSVGETAALREALADVDPAADPTDSGLAKILSTLADRFGSGERLPGDDKTVTPLHSGSPLHNLFHRLGIAHP